MTKTQTHQAPHARKNGHQVGHKPDAGLSEYVFGKLQPQALPLEEAVLGALMIEREALPTVMDVLRPESFYLESHQHIYRAVVHLFQNSEPVDILTVAEQLRKTGDLDKIGGAYYLTELSGRVASAANIEYHARIIAQKHIQRELIRVSTRTIKDAYDDTTDVFSLLDQAESGLFQIATGGAGKQAQTIGDLLRRGVRRISDLRNTPDGLTGVDTGFRVVNSITGGWQNQDLIIIAARPGMGKTALVLSGVVEAAKSGTKVLLFSLEMSASQLSDRIASAQIRVSSDRLRGGRITDADERALESNAAALENMPLTIDDSGALTVNDVRARARRHKMKQGLDLVVVDYLQLLAGEKGGNREQEIAGIARALKGLAKELDVPVIALSQLSRAVEIRGGAKRPQLSDLRESGAIEQDSDIVAFLYRPEYYQILEDENGRGLKGVAELNFAKHRNGKLGTVRLRFEDEFAKFSDPDDQNFTAPHPDSFTTPRQEPGENTPF